METYNEPIAAVLVGLLLCLAAGVRIILPLLAVNLLAIYQVIRLPHDMEWLGTLPTMIVLIVAAAAETIVHYIPAAGTGLKAAATPLAFAAGTLLMAVPLSDHNPLYQWTLAAFIGGSLATLMHLGVTGARAATEPVNMASLGIFGLVWNTIELLASILLTALGALCVIAGWAVGVVALVAIVVLLLAFAAKSYSRWKQPAVSA